MMLEERVTKLEKLGEIESRISTSILLSISLSLKFQEQVLLRLKALELSTTEPIPKPDNSDWQDGLLREGDES